MSFNFDAFGSWRPNHYDSAMREEEPPEDPDLDPRTDPDEWVLMLISIMSSINAAPAHKFTEHEKLISRWIYFWCWENTYELCESVSRTVSIIDTDLLRRGIAQWHTDHPKYAGGYAMRDIKQIIQ